MGNDDKDSDDQWFKEVYGNGYTGPSSRPLGRDTARVDAKSSKTNAIANANADKSDDEEEPRDPNAIPTDFTSREAKVWEAKAKAVERNWKRRKEEELKCRICGEWGHFPQGCPSTLGANRKCEEVVQRIHLKDKHLKSKLTGNGGSVIHKIEKDTGCQLELEDDPSGGNGAFSVRVSGPNRFVVSKSVNVINDLIDKFQDESNQQTGRSRAPYPESSSDHLAAAQLQRIAAEKLQQKSYLYDSRASHPEYGQKLSLMESQQQWEAASIQELNGRAAFGRSRVTDLLTPSSEDALYYDWNQKESRPTYKSDLLAAHGQQLLPRTSEESEQIFLDEAVELSKQQAAEEGRETDRHREQMRIISEHFEQRGIQLRAKHTEQLKRFLQHEGHSWQQYPDQATHDHFGTSGGSYFPFRNHGSIPYDQIGVNATKNIVGHEAQFDSFREPGHYQSSTYAYHRKQDYEAKLSRGMQGYD